MPNALITGGAKRIGAAIVKRLVAEGFRVVVHYNTSLDEATTLRDEIIAGGGECALVQGDLSNRHGVEGVYKESKESVGQLDLIVNNASLFVNDDVVDYDGRNFDEHANINFKAPVYFADLLSQETIEGDAVIINMLDNKVFAVNPDFFSYTISKCALLAATKMMAMRFGGKPRVCGIAPSITLISGKQSEENFEKSSKINLLGRKVYPEDVADAVYFIWQTKSYNNDVVILDAGQSLMQLPRDVAFMVKEGMFDE